MNKYLHTVASVGFLFTLNYDAWNHELKIYIPKVMHFKLLSKWQYTVNIKYFNFHIRRKWKLCHHLWIGIAITSALLEIKQGVNTYSLTEKSVGTHSWAAGQIKNAPCLHINKYIKEKIC